MAVPRRGLSDIRTLSGSGDGRGQPHKVHLKIACLEMEKIRRGTEREAARKRVEDIDSRLAEIDPEKAALLECLGLAEQSAAQTAAQRQTEPAAARRRGKRGLAFRY